MKFQAPLLHGKLIQRYKRFLADIELDDGRDITAHCANPGSMLGLKDPGSEVWVSPADNPKRKLKFTWELIRVEGALVGINTALPNKIVQEAIENGFIAELQGYENLRREVKYGKNSRIDILLEGAGVPTCYVEIKSVTLKRGDSGEFPDSVTARGAKHLVELANMVAQGHRAVTVYLAQRDDVGDFTIAEDIDPAYGSAFKAAGLAGVEVLAYGCYLSQTEIKVDRALNLKVSD